MKAGDKLPQVIKKVLQGGTQARAESISTYPSEVVETVIFHRLHLDMPAGDALKSYRQLRSEFVDWNEIRVSTIQEIREQLLCEIDSLELAVFIKDFLELVHRERQCVNLEFLGEQNLTDVRKFLRQVRGIDQATIDLILYRLKEHPVFPMNPVIEAIVQAAGLTKLRDTRDRKSKALFEMVGPDSVLPFHHFLVDLSRELVAGKIADNGSSADEMVAVLKANKAPLRTACSTFLQKSRAGQKKVASKSRETKTKGKEATP